MHAQGRAASGRPLAAARERRADLRRRDGGAVGARACRCPSATCACWREGRRSRSPGASWTSSTRPATPPTTSSTSTAPTARRSWATSPACGSRPPDFVRAADAAAGHRRASRGSASIDLVAGRRPARLALTHFGMVDDPPPHLERTKAAPRRAGRARRTRCSSEHGDTRRRRWRAFVEEVDRRTREAAGAETAARVRGRARRSSSSGRACGATGRSRPRRAAASVMATETVELPRVGGPGTGGGGRGG